MADGSRPQRVFADRGEDGADRRAHDAQGDDDADEIAERKKRIQGPARREVQRGESKVEVRRRHPGQSVLATGPIRQWIELDEVEYFCDGDRDHGEVDPRAAQRQQSDQVADNCRDDHADEQRGNHVRETRSGEQVGSDEPAGAVESRLTKREQAGIAEQDVEADAEQSPDQDAVDRIGRCVEIGQHERHHDQPDRRQRFDEVATSTDHRLPALIPCRVCRAGRAAAPAARASWPRTASRTRSRD